MIDFHCHLDLYPGPVAVVAQCIKQQIYVLSVTTVPSAFEGTVKLVPPDSRIRTALGLHPALVEKRSRELALFEKLLPQTRYVGEIGLDGSRECRATIDMQREVFRHILHLCARSGGKVLSLHSRGAIVPLLDDFTSEPEAGTAVLHWFVGSARQVARAVELGCWFSVGPSMLASERGRAAAATMPMDRVLPESDGPFGLMEGKPIYPWEAWKVCVSLAQLWDEPVKQIERRLQSNFRKLVLPSTQKRLE